MTESVFTDDRVFVIAEAGVNHNGSTDMACALVDLAAEAGADAVKFQTFRATEVIGCRTPKAEYQARTTDADESQLEMVRKLELSEAAHKTLIARARSRGIRFMSTPFDAPSLRMLTQQFGLGTIKVPSGEITNAPFLLEIARAARRIILSTGMSTLEEVRSALSALAFGFTKPSADTPRNGDLEQAFASEEGQQVLRDRVVLLHCTSEYPAPFGEVNLRAMDTMASAFGLPVGYSDHTPGFHVSLAAVARGAKVIEKHFTLDRNLPGPDHRASLEPNELRELVRQVREIESALGDGVKRPTVSERKNRDVARKCLVAARPIKAGEVLTTECIACKRSGAGLSPFAYWQILGQTAKRNYNIDEPLDA